MAEADGRTVLTLLDGEVGLRNEHGELPLAGGEQGTVEPGQAPRKTAALDLLKIIQWCLYYPAILDPDEAGLGHAEQAVLADSLSAYRSGDLLRALSRYPDARQPASDAERVYQAALLLAVGQVAQAEASLAALRSPAPAADALRQLIATAKNQKHTAARPPVTATEWMAESYAQQARLKLDLALAAARAAVRQSPRFGFAAVRVAELEFSFGRAAAASLALDQGLALSPRNAQALALQGFLLAARNKTTAALNSFDQAIAVDAALGNAWLGRGLCRIRSGDTRRRTRRLAGRRRA